MKFRSAWVLQLAGKQTGRNGLCLSSVRVTTESSGAKWRLLCTFLLMTFPTALKTEPRYVSGLLLIGNLC